MGCEGARQRHNHLLNKSEVLKWSRSHSPLPGAQEITLGSPFALCLGSWGLSEALQAAVRSLEWRWGSGPRQWHPDLQKHSRKKKLMDQHSTKAFHFYRLEHYKNKKKIKKGDLLSPSLYKYRNILIFPFQKGQNLQIKDSSPNWTELALKKLP